MNAYIGEAILKNNVYTGSWRGRTVLILESIEQALWAGSGAIGSLTGKATLEHIMPQSIENMVEWQTELGDTWQQIHQDYLHTLGNLTLVTGDWNSELSNRPFNGPDKNGNPGKKEKLSAHGLKLNSTYFNAVDSWNEDAIKTRAQYLTDKVLSIWPSFGGVPTSKTPAASKVPEILTIEDQQFTLNPQTWRQVLETTVEYFIQQGKFDQVRDVIAKYLNPDDPTKTWDRHHKLLSNGWRLYISFSAYDITSYCKKMMVAAGMSNTKWDIQTK